MKIELERLVRVMIYNEYMTLLNELFAEGKTTGPNQSDDLFSFGLNYNDLGLYYTLKRSKIKSLV